MKLAHSDAGKRGASPKDVRVGDCLTGGIKCAWALAVRAGIAVFSSCF